ncbi:Fe-S-cluster-containing hydrogenase subunit [Synechococcus sp. PCC 7502]|uniref:Light dependent period protein LdpA domain-containing protein n=1 Tax=Synechococcus sp. PCC 7502 TaxID=1173263 RepID=UPI00029FE964|nr:LdpA C-terminal domain-containing domain [Synechococcus sp. PCC 7502]AFY74876.1 Fe-S-cluster-containing hydrogenase subunit [Synechococcus sp. PCC 7502]
MNYVASPLDSLRSHQWFKLICGASFQHLPAIRNLALVYTLAGNDCIDMAPDPAVIRAAKEGIKVAQKLDKRASSPLIMVSFNAGEDPHFRKAKFSSDFCPSGCDRPCINICPTNAINLNGVIENLCYGCGRCLPVCPPQIIYTQEQVYAPELIKYEEINAIEIHTHIGCTSEFKDLWEKLRDLIPQLQVVAVSFPDGENLKEYLLELLEIMQPAPAHLIWQTDGRPMSGDIGDGTTRAALLLAQKVLNFNLPRGFVQLAGGTNASTVSKVKFLNIPISGIAYGSYARKLIADLLELGGDRLEEYPELLKLALERAKSLVSEIK